MTVIDAFDGWMVIDVDILKDAFQKLPRERSTLEHVSQQIGINKATLSGYLNGKKHPNLKNFKKLCLFFHLDPRELLGLTIVSTRTL